jgi:hypothetical protein
VAYDYTKGVFKWIVQVQFRVGPTPPAGLHIRTLPVYGEAAHMREPVRR